MYNREHTIKHTGGDHMGVLGDHTDVQKRIHYQIYQRGSNRWTRGHIDVQKKTYYQACRRGSNGWTRGSYQTHEGIKRVY
jgi:hypothetical protein